MTVLKNTVLLLKVRKSEGESDKYATILNQNGYVVKQVNTLEFAYENLKELRKKLEKPHQYCGLILTSPRCVHAIYQALDGNILDTKWKLQNNFVVGEATHKDANKLGLTCTGNKTGNANNLAKLIIEGKDHFDTSKPFLYPHGNLKVDTLQQELKKENLSVENLVVYDTIPNRELENELKEASNNFTSIPEFVIFFNPSGVHHVVPYIRRLQIDLSSVKFIAFGPTTEKVMKEHGLPVHASAKNPTPEDLMKAIKS